LTEQFIANDCDYAVFNEINGLIAQKSLLEIVFTVVSSCKIVIRVLLLTKETVAFQHDLIVMVRIILS